MSDTIIPGTTVEYPNPSYQEYSSPSDALAINVACLVDADFRRAVKNRDVSLRQSHGSGMDPAHEAFYADEAKKRLGVSFGRDYKFPEGFTAKTFQQAFLKGISPLNLRRDQLTEAEKKNLEHVFSLMKSLNPEAFSELKVGDLSNPEKFDMVLGMCSKFTMEDINQFISIHRVKSEHDFWPGAQFIMSEGTKAKLDNVLKQHDTSIAYLAGYTSPDWADVPEQDFKIRGLREHSNSVVIDEIMQNPDRFFAVLEQTSNPGIYAKAALYDCSSSGKMDALEKAGILKRLEEIKKQAPQRQEPAIRREAEAPRLVGERDTLVRKGISGLLNLTNRMMPPTQGRRVVKEALAKGYRFFYPKSSQDR